MRKALLLWAVSLLLLCTGCVGTMLQEREYTDEALPPIRSVPPAPIGDTQQDWECKMVLYLPDADGARLSPEPRTITVRAGQTKQEACVEALLETINESYFWPSGQPLLLSQVSNAVESTGEIVTVNLHSSTRRLSERAFFALRTAITNTLTELKEVNYVNILVNGKATGLDLAETLPAGLMARYPSGDILAYWNQIETERIAEESELQKNAVLYFVSEDGSSLLGKVRNISFSKRDTASYARQLLDEMAVQTSISDVSIVVPPSDWFARDPVHFREPETATNYIELYFVNFIDDHLLLNGANRGMLFSSIAYTLTNFIPQLEGVKIYVGGQLVTQMMLMDGNEWNDAGGMMRREHFVSLASDICTVYYPLADGSGIRAVKKPIAQRYRSQPRALLRQLLDPSQDDMLTNVFPQGITDADILGVMAQGDTILVNLSDAFQKACEDMTEQEERNMIYCMVNTLTEVEVFRRVCFYVNGEQKPLAGYISMNGEFLRHPGAIR